MKDKILNIVAEHCEGWKNCEALTEKLFDLYNGSNNKGALKAFVKEYIEAWEDGMGGDTDLYRKAKILL